MLSNKSLLGIGIIPDEDSFIPERNEGDACFDLRSTTSGYLLPGNRVMIDVGFSMAVPKGYAAIIQPRSGLAVKHGIDTMAGVIDSGYRGKINVILVNHGSDAFDIAVGDRIAQMQIVEVPEVQFKKTTVLNNTDRGSGGFGSTGIE